MERPVAWDVLGRNDWTFSHLAAVAQNRDGFINWANRSIYQLIDCLIDWLIDWIIDWWMDWLIDWLIDLLIDWSIDCFIDWLNGDWSVDFKHLFRLFFRLVMLWEVLIFSCFFSFYFSFREMVLPVKKVLWLSGKTKNFEIVTCAVKCRSKIFVPLETYYFGNLVCSPVTERLNQALKAFE